MVMADDCTDGTSGHANATAVTRRRAPTWRRPGPVAER
jgi:hypothetical protein